MIYNISKIFMLFIVYSIIGWIVEISINMIIKKKFTNRGFFLGPYCPIYGVGTLLIIVLLNKYEKDPIALFIMSMIICSLLEYITSFLMEVIFKNRWWDYSDKKFNINGRICLEYMIPFGIGSTIVYYFINPLIVKLISIPSESFMIILSMIIFILFITDVIISICIISKISSINKSINIDSTEEITKQVKEIIKGKSLPQRRLVKAFPNMKVNRKYINKILKKQKNDQK